MKSERGFSLIEVTVALALIGITVVGLISSLGLASNTLRANDIQETAKDFASTQMEYVQNLTYSIPCSYTLLDLSAKYPGFSVVTPVATPLDPLGDGYSNDDGIQLITIAVQHSGKTVYTLVGQKVKW